MGAPLASLQADLADASCTSRELPWSCQMTTQKVRPAMSTRHSHHSRSEVAGSRGGSVVGQRDLPRCQPARGPLLTRLGTWQATGFLAQDQLCLKTLQPTRTVPCFRLGHLLPFYIYIYITPNMRIKQIVSSSHLFST